MHIAFSSIKEVSFLWSHRSNCKITRDKKSPILTQIERFRTVTEVWIHWWLRSDIWACRSIKNVSYCFSSSSINPSSAHGTNICRFWPEFGVSVLWLQSKSIDGYRTMHNAWGSTAEVPYNLSRSFQVRTGQKIANFVPNLAFMDCNSSLNSLMVLKRCARLGVP